MTRIETVEELVVQLETFDAWDSVSIGVRHGKPCILIHDNGQITGCIYLSRDSA